MSLPRNARPGDFRASTVEPDARAYQNIHRPTQTVLPHRNFSRAEHSIDTALKIRSLDFGCEHAMFETYGKTWPDLTGYLPFAVYAVNA
jgi:hypothetical protein